MPTPRRQSLLAAVTAALVVASGLVAAAVPLGAASAAAAPPSCAPGARTLSQPGDHVYPETGNGGYTSVHTDVNLRYDAVHNLFLRGTHVSMAQRATQCLSEFSLDFERHGSPDTAAGPNLVVRTVSIDGVPARYRFVQPTYPGDPKGADDPDPRAHQAGQGAVVGGPANNPLPPACSPQLGENDSPDAYDGQPCPATKLVVTPSRPIPAGNAYVVTVSYTGRPGVHRDGDGETEGWFRSNKPAGDGSFVTTEPIGTQAWMPLNNHPTAKPSYDFYDTVTAGRTAVANGMLVSHRNDAPDKDFPQGSASFHWHQPAPVANYLVENSVGHFDMTQRVAANGTTYYTFQGSSITAAQKAANAKVMDMQQDITEFESQFNGTYPFRSAGVLVGVPSAAFEEEMQTMITFEGGRIDTDTLYHENMHQWWGDNVSEGSYRWTFFKEGMATLGEYYYTGRQAQDAAGGPSTVAGNAAFEKALDDIFTRNYDNTRLFRGQPSDPTPYTLFSGAATYTRPGTAYLALRRILGPGAFTRAMQQIQRDHGGRTITETQLKSAFARFLPDRGCVSRLNTFFTQWWDTAYPQGSVTRPSITGANFYDAVGRCT